MNVTRLYRPSNGTEGDAFQEAFCYRCQHETGEHPCDILTRTMLFSSDADGYPREWVEDDVPYSQDTNPRCTAFLAEDVPGSTYCADSRQMEIVFLGRRAVKTAPPPDTPEVIAAGREGRERARPKACRPDEPQCYVVVGRAGILDYPSKLPGMDRCRACLGKLRDYSSSSRRQYA